MNEPSPGLPARQPVLIGAVIGLLTIFAALCVGSGWNTSPTYDESFLIAAGYSFLTGDVHAQPTANLVLSEKWEALPLLAMKLDPPTQQEYQTAARQLHDAHWLLFFSSESRMHAILRAARAMNTLLGMALALIVFFWSRSLHGNAAGLVSLGFCCLCPVFISNSGLATTDIATALFFSLAVWTFWALLHRISIGTILACGLAVGGLMATKLSGVLFVPMALLMLAARLWWRRPVSVALPGNVAREETHASQQFFLMASASMASALVAYIVLWAIYGFHYSFGLQTLNGSSVWYPFDAQPRGLIDNYVAWCRKLRLLPEHILLDVQLFKVQRYRAFLLGQYSQSGWWYFFPVAWFFKTPIPFLLALTAGLVTVMWAGRQRRSQAAGDQMASPIRFYEFTPLAVWLAVYTGALMAGHLNIGIRHLLPVYPILFIFVGVLARAGWGRRSAWVLTGALLVWSAGELRAVYPQTLAYLNEFAGGPGNYRVLVDSSYEWGQDLPAVEKWLARRAGRPGSDRPVYFSYFGSGCLDAFDLKGALLLPSFIDPPRRFILTLEPGTYLISATMLQSVHNRTAFGPWCKSYEDEYKTLAARINRIEQRPQDGAELKTFAQTGLLQRYDDLRLARLCGYLRKREPDERITFGILVYELNQAQLDQALSGPAPEGR